MGFIGKIAKLIGFIVLAFIAIAVVGGIAGSGSKSNTATTTTQQSATSASAPAQASQTKAAQAAPTAAALPTVGSEAQSGGWKIAFQKMDTESVLGRTQFSKGTPAQGKFVVLTLAATNLQKQTSNLNSWDFVLKSADGVTYKTSSEGSTALIFDDKGVKPLGLAEEIQPGLTKPFRLVFDVNPAVKEYTLEAAGNKFAVTLSS